jgi:hypothetical protein
MFSSTNESNSAPDWNTMVTFLRIGRNSDSGLSNVAMGNDDLAAIA